jgi:hypothetical protein
MTAEEKAVLIETLWENCPEAGVLGRRFGNVLWFDCEDRDLLQRVEVSLLDRIQTVGAGIDGFRQSIDPVPQGFRLTIWPRGDVE